jgi:hypothetical protein
MVQQITGLMARESSCFIEGDIQEENLKRFSALI